MLLEGRTENFIALQRSSLDRRYPGSRQHWLYKAISYWKAKSLDMEIRRLKDTNLTNTISDC